MEKLNYYTLNNILKYKAQYNMVIGERSNGKTYSVLEYGIKKYFETGKQMAIVRRYLEDFRSKRGMVMFNALVDNDLISKYSKGEYNCVRYYGGQWFMQKKDENGETIKTCDTPFAYAFSLAQQEHDKSTAYPNVTTVLFDEILSRDGYLNEEFVLFMNTLSTIIRQRNDVTIFMLGNTISKSCPYFAEMGLVNIRKMKQGVIDLYEYGESGLKVAVEFSDTIAKKKPSDVYFSFNNPKLQGITGKGNVWEMGIYPHKPIDFVPKDILLTYFIQWETNIFQCEIIMDDDCNTFTYIHRKTTPIKSQDDIIFKAEYSHIKTQYRNIYRPVDKITQKIKNMFVKEKIFYQDNSVGEDIRTYLVWCKQNY